MIRLIACDLDGTLLNSRGAGSCRSRWLIRRNDVSMLEAVGHPYLTDTASRKLRQKGFAPCRDVSDTLDQLLSSL